MNIRQAISSPRLFGGLFKDSETWQLWFVFLSALFGLPVVDLKDVKLFKKYTGWSSWPAERIREAFVIAGRRSGKSFISALIAVYLACFKDWRRYLSAGERGWIFIIAVDKAQAQIIKRYISGILNTVPGLKAKIEKETAEAIDLKDSISIAVKTCSFRTVRGYTLLAAILEEMAFYRSELSANPDREVLAAVRPALATIPESLLIGISTPYSRQGCLWEAFRTNYGKAGDVLVWKAPSAEMNPTIDARLINRAIAEDPESARAEWLCEWRTDVSAFLSQEAVEACVSPGRRELPKIKDADYAGFVDPSGGRQDSFTLAIGHKEESGLIVLDVLRERVPPFRPEAVVEEFCEVLKAYEVKDVQSDRFAGEWVTDAFRKFGIEVNPAEKSASELYLELLPLISQGSTSILDQKRLISQLASLERRLRTGGKDLITHYPGGHDDCANAFAGVAYLLANKGNDEGAFFVSEDSVYPGTPGRGWGGDDEFDADGNYTKISGMEVFGLHEKKPPITTKDLKGRGK